MAAEVTEEFLDFTASRGNDLRIAGLKGGCRWCLCASRWYEANAAIVAYDKDLAIRLVRAIVQLNEVMHGSIASEPGITGYPKRNVIMRDFVEAFRRFDPRGLVSDDLLDKIYASIRREKLYQARHPSRVASQPDIIINVSMSLSTSEWF